MLELDAADDEAPPERPAAPEVPLELPVIDPEPVAEEVELEALADDAAPGAVRTAAARAAGRVSAGQFAGRAAARRAGDVRSSRGVTRGFGTECARRATGDRSADRARDPDGPMAAAQQAARPP